MFNQFIRLCLLVFLLGMSGMTQFIEYQGLNPLDHFSSIIGIGFAAALGFIGLTGVFIACTLLKLNYFPSERDLA